MYHKIIFIYIFLNDLHLPIGVLPRLSCFLISQTTSAISEAILNLRTTRYSILLSCYSNNYPKRNLAPLSKEEFGDSDFHDIAHTIHNKQF